MSRNQSPEMGLQHPPGPLACSSNKAPSLSSMTIQSSDGVRNQSAGPTNAEYLEAVYTSKVSKQAISSQSPAHRVPFGALTE
jgi:hypothetical protein